MNLLKLILVTGLCSQSALAGLVEAQKDKVEIFAAADKSSAVIASISKGDSLSAGERSGMYWSVKTKDGKPGYVSVLAVKVKPDDKAGLNDAMREAVKNGRAQQAADGGRTRSAVMGVRGLDDTSDTGLAANLRPNLHAVYMMEDRETAVERVEDLAKKVASEIEGKMNSEK
jgi:hypothetical protein